MAAQGSKRQDSAKLMIAKDRRGGGVYHHRLPQSITKDGELAVLRLWQGARYSESIPKSSWSLSVFSFCGACHFGFVHKHVGGIDVITGHCPNIGCAGRFFGNG